MKFTYSVLLPALCFTARVAAAATAHIYIYDPQSQPRSETQPQSLEPTAARLVLAQRAGVEKYHSSDLARTEVIDAINKYGVRTPLFTSDKSDVKKAFILVEAVSDPDVSLPSLRSYTSFELDPAPGAAASKGLFVDLARQSDPESFSHLEDDKLFALLTDSRSLASNGDMFHVARSAEDLEAIITKLVKTASWSITAFVVPHNSEVQAERTMFQWGTYEMPGTQMPLHKRQQIRESPVAANTKSKPVKSFSAPVSAAANNTTPFRGIIQACYSSQSACVSATRNCTGHGHCSKKYHDSSARKGNGLDCYTCSCAPTNTPNRKKTTYWGGPACQKKDISVEFWLIVLFTVGMIFLIGFAVGSIWEMGSQELPSVIGAGVSGPTARK